MAASTKSSTKSGIRAASPETSCVRGLSGSGPLQAPFPWFGGKSRVAPVVWDAFGAVDNYVEPFAGSLATLLASPYIPKAETVNDLDGFIANFWRAMAADPEALAAHADWPVNENDLHARHAWLVNERATLTARLEGDPDFYDVKIAGWWVWGICSWIGGGWCSGKGPWRVEGDKLIDSRKEVSLSAGQGVNRQLPHLSGGRGVNRQLPLVEWFDALASRLRGTRVCCGDWARVLGPTPTEKLGVTAVFLDPPYSAEADWCGGAYACEDGDVAHRVREWALANGDNPKLRIALCGYDGEHKMPGWREHAWSGKGGYGTQGGGRGRANAKRERVWFSPHCVHEADMFGGVFA